VGNYESGSLLYDLAKSTFTKTFPHSDRKQLDTCGIKFCTMSFYWMKQNTKDTVLQS